MFFFIRFISIKTVHVSMIIKQSRPPGIKYTIKGLVTCISIVLLEHNEKF